jgi:hypothetical protein
MTDDDAYTAGVAEIKALRERLRRLEEMAQAAAKPPTLTDRTPNLGDALDVLRREGTASGSAVDALKRAVTGPRPTTTAPSRDQLAEAARVLTADLRGAPTIEEAFSDMQRRASRRDAIETAQAGANGRVDALDGPTSRAIDKLDRILKGQRP